MSKINRSLHERFNRNHSPKCLYWGGGSTISKIICSDPNRSIRKANDWTFACLVKNDGTINLACLYSDYLTTSGLFIGINNTDPNTTAINIINRTGSTSVGITFFLDNIYIDSWLSVVVSYNSATNQATVYGNGKSAGTQTLAINTEWAIANNFGIYSVPYNFSNALFEGGMSTYCILDKQADNDFIESFNTSAMPDENSYNNVTFFTNLDKVNKF